MRKASRTGPGAVAVLALLALGGCGADGGEGPGAQDTTDVTADAAVGTAQAVVAAATGLTVEEFVPPGPSVAGVDDLAGGTVHYIPASSQVGTFMAVRDGMAEALGHAGVTVETCDGAGDPAAMAACVTAAVEADADVIVTGAVPEDRIATALIHASRAEIPVLFTQTAPTGRGYPAEVGYLSPDHAEQQGWLAEWVVADSAGTASVLVVQLADTPAMQGWVQEGALPVYEACPGCATSLLEVTTKQLEELPALVEEALAASPETRYVHVTMDVAVDSVVQGIESAGRTDVLVVSQDGTPEVLEQVTPDGPVGAVAGFDHTALGWYAADQVLRLMTGGESLRDVDFPYRRLVTAEDVGDGYGDPEFAEGFLDLWGLGGG